MGFRFRKSIKLPGGFRVNASKSGIGYSWGTKGFRVTKTAKGTTRTTASIPGTGISYVQESKKQKVTRKTVQTVNMSGDQGNIDISMDSTEHSYFDGGLLQLIGWHLLGAIVTVFTLGICYPWAVCMIYRWETKHTVINGHRLSFDGTALQLFGSWIKWLLLTIITLGIYGFWLGIKVKKWITKHTHFETPVPLSVNVESTQPAQSTAVYTSSAPTPPPTPWEAPEKDWVDKIAPALPLIYVLWFCGIAAAVFFVLNLIFK